MSERIQEDFKGKTLRLVGLQIVYAKNIDNTRRVSGLESNEEAAVRRAGLTVVEAVKAGVSLEKIERALNWDTNDPFSLQERE